MLNSTSFGIRLDGHKGTWRVIDVDSTRMAGMAHPYLYVLENEQNLSRVTIDESGHVII